MQKVLIIGEVDKFTHSLSDCLREDERYSVTLLSKIIRPITHPDILIFNFLKDLPSKVEFESSVSYIPPATKVILIENGKDLYSENMKPPFSVYNEFLSTKGKKTKLLLHYEQIITKLFHFYAIFRTSEIYGPDIRYGIIHDLMHKDKMTLCDGERDFVYEGDFIQAVEVALDNGAMGSFDIALGKSFSTRELVKLVNQHRTSEIKIRWRRKKEVQSYSCENFKFYKWQPLVSLNCGLRAISNQKKSLGGFYGRV